MNKQQDSRYKFKNKINADNFEMIEVGQLRQDKKIAFIYNPSSGKKLDKR